DFAWGTSSRSSKLVHGGLRYLKEGQFRLTLESVRERDRLMAQAPELIEPQSFLIADCPGRRPGAISLRLGLALYDRMAGQHARGHADLRATQMLAPGLAPTGLRGATWYRDAKTDDARLVQRVLAEAARDGALTLNYARAGALLKEGAAVAGARVEDLCGGPTVEVRARAVINATGVWADRVRAGVQGRPMLRPLRGSHLVVPYWRLPVPQAVSLMHPQDGRPVFFYPWEGVTLIGTTDLDHRGDLMREPSITAAEVDYLLAAVNDQFPGIALVPADVTACYAGVRPVVDDGSATPSKAPREHVVLDESGLITVCGGKLTTFRTMAQDGLALAANRVGKRFAHDTGAVFTATPEMPALWPITVRRRLAARYGFLAAQRGALAQDGDFEPVPGTDTLWLELRVAAQFEAVVHLDDLLLRRTRLGILLPRGALDHERRIRALCQRALGWNDARWQAEVDGYRALIQAHYSLPAHDTQHARGDAT
ncbi:MAG TPA: glycerol-3-phosphate dehydrogenase/oxidase, partial [Ramlibacter sp.]|nr:glycerol-3-phosphate dehydrogenase/oxidase [Ramlibacter sp.]